MFLIKKLCSIIDEYGVDVEWPFDPKKWGKTLERIPIQKREETNQKRLEPLLDKELEEYEIEKTIGFPIEFWLKMGLDYDWISTEFYIKKPKVCREKYRKKPSDWEH